VELDVIEFRCERTFGMTKEHARTKEEGDCWILYIIDLLMSHSLHTTYGIRDVYWYQS
jgi:hypothetical protein